MTTDQSTAVRGMDCVCYLAKDLARARTFYEGVLGMVPALAGEAWVEYELADGSTFALAVLPNGGWLQTGGAMFAVDDISPVLDRARAAGSNVHGDVFETKVCFQVWCDDLEGNTFALHKRKKI
jgi:predicted enzyme related to lactoylglutathione lyase